MKEPDRYQTHYFLYVRARVPQFGQVRRLGVGAGVLPRGSLEQRGYGRRCYRHGVSMFLAGVSLSGVATGAGFTRMGNRNRERSGPEPETPKPPRTARMWKGKNEEQPSTDLI